MGKGYSMLLAQHFTPETLLPPAGDGAFLTPPNPFDTQEQFNCFHHLDLQDMTLAELEHERIKVLVRLSLAARSEPWFGERLQRLEEEIERIRNPQNISHLSSVQDRDEQRQAAHYGVVHPPSVRSGSPLSDREIIRRMLSAINGPLIRVLWHGDIRAYRCHSEAKASLINSLTWWCQGDANQVDRIFRQSGLCRRS